MKPIKNPNLLIVGIEENFFLVVNPNINDGLKVINKLQLSVLNSIDGRKNIETLSNEHELKEEEITLLCDSFLKKEIISYTGIFSEPHSPSLPSTMNFWVHTSNSCNLRCSYCYIHTLGGKQSFDQETIKIFFEKITETVKKRKLRKVVLRLAGGEPFLKFKHWINNLTELREILFNLQCDLHIVFLTNLVILPDEVITFIKQTKSGIGVSLDGLNEFQDLSRHFADGSGSFKFIEKNLKKLEENDIYPAIMTVVSNNNLDGLVDFTKYLISKRLRFRYSFVQDETLDLCKLKNVLMQCYDVLEFAIENYDYSFSSLHQLCDLKFGSVAVNTCSNGFSTAAIYPDGEIYFCQRNFGVTESSGSIYDDTDLISTIQKKNYYEALPQDCEICNYRYVCTGGCPLERGSEKDPHCEIYRFFFPIYYRLMGKERLLRIKKSIL